jgi:S1-C subfamily serine protease
VIRHSDIESALARRAGEAARAGALRSLTALAPAAVSVALAAASLLAARAMFRPQQLATLDLLLDHVRSLSGRAFWLGLASATFCAVALHRTRRGRHFRSVPLLAGHGVALVACVASAALAALSYLPVLGGTGWDHTRVPRLEESLTSVPGVRRIMRATVVILAPDASGDARSAALGVGSVVSHSFGRVWVLTCSHVAMPYASVASFRDPAAAPAVLLTFSDGRSTEGRVRWTAPPPLDVALVEATLDEPPEPILLSLDALDVERGAGVMFVPNPLRAGWKIVHGNVLGLDPHSTPAGRFSLLRTSIPLARGDSGSGLFDAGGHLIGLNTWYEQGPEGTLGISLPAQALIAIREVMEARPEEARSDPTRRRPTP